MDALQGSAGPGSTPNRFPVEFRSKLVSGPLNSFGTQSAFWSGHVTKWLSGAQSAFCLGLRTIQPDAPETPPLDSNFWIVSSGAAGSGAYGHTIPSHQNSTFKYL